MKFRQALAILLLASGLGACASYYDDGAYYDDGSYYPGYYAPGPYANQPFRYRNTEPPFFEIGTHKNRFTPPPKRPTPHGSRGKGGGVSAPAMP